MSIDKFGRHSLSLTKTLKYPAGYKALVNKDGNCNLQNNLIINLADPVSPTDAVNKQYVDNLISSSIKKIEDKLMDLEQFKPSPNRVKYPTNIDTTPKFKFILKDGKITSG